MHDPTTGAAEAEAEAEEVSRHTRHTPFLHPPSQHIHHHPPHTDKAAAAGAGAAGAGSGPKRRQLDTTRQGVRVWLVKVPVRFCFFFF